MAVRVLAAKTVPTIMVMLVALSGGGAMVVVRNDPMAKRHCQHECDGEGECGADPFHCLV